MNKSQIIGIICLMTAALVGLTVVQIYWINNAIKLKQQEFSENVNEVMSEVVQDHNRKIAAAVLEKAFTTYQSNGVTYLIIDGDTIDVFSTPAPGTAFGQIFNDGIPTTWPMTGLDPFMSIDGAELHNFDNNNSVSDVSEWASTLLKEIAGEISTMSMSMQQNVDLEYLEASLKTGFSKRGIDLKYELGVCQPSRGKLMTLGNVHNQNALLKSEYQENLFPAHFLSGRTLMYVHFPHRFNYLIRSMWLRLSTSFLFVIVIIFSFSFTVWTIFRQKKLSEMKNDFINNMTHEFKTPVTTISLAGQAIRDPDILKNENRLSRFSNVIIEESNKLTNQIEKILQMAILDKGDFKLKLTQVDLHEVIHDLMESYAIRLEGLGEVTVSLKASRFVLTGDEVHLTNIFDNLLDNAVKYSKKRYASDDEEEEVKVRISTFNKKGGIVVRIEDNGIGMSKDTVKKVFDKFYRASTGNVHNVKGFGLGLSYVQTMIDAHEGKVNVKSELNKGTIFDVYIPFELTNN